MSTEIVSTIERSLTATLDVVRAFPEESYSFWPAPKAMTVAEQIEHLAHNLENVIAPIAVTLGGPTLPETPTGEPVTRLEAAAQHVRDVLAGVSETDWQREIAYPDGFSMSVLKAALTILEHDEHHRGQLTVALRALDIEPPSRWKAD